MKLGTVLTACDSNYSRFIPIFIKAWQYYYPTVKIKIIYIGNLSEKYKQFAQFITEFNPPSGLPTPYIAQTIRLLWPSLLNEKDGVLITDIDMIPTNNTYFTNPIHNLPDDIFVNYRQGDGLVDQIYMCYNIAPSHLWSEIFHIYSEADINKFLVQNFNNEYDSCHGGRGWYTDQELFFTFFMKWKNFNTESYIFLTDIYTKYNRFDWVNYIYDKLSFIKHIKSKKYSDCHIYSNQCPYDENELLELIDIVISA